MKKSTENTLFIFFSFILISLLHGLYIFDMPNWDFVSYHYYIGWAFVTDRIDTDFLPCMFRSYFNPYLDAILYIMIEKLNHIPKLFMVLTSLRYGIFLFFAYKIYDFVFINKKQEKVIALLFCIVLAMTSPILIHSSPFDNNDLSCAIIIIIGLYLFIKNIFEKYNPKRNCIILFATILFGTAIGLKYTNAPCIVAIYLASLFSYNKVDKPIKTALIMLFGAIIGTLITSGYWGYILWEKFQNPFFPYFNQIFHSPLADTSSVLSTDFKHLRAKSLTDFIFMPFKNSGRQSYIGLEWTYFDLKIWLGFMMVIFSLITLKLKEYQEQVKPFININILYFITMFTFFAYYVNLAVLGNIRYILLIFVTLPIIMYAYIPQILNKKHLNKALLIILILYTFTYVGTDKNIRPSSNLAEKIIDIQDMHIKDNATVLCANVLSCYIAPKQNPKAKYIGFVLPQKIVEDNKYNFYYDNLDNRYYTNLYLESILPDIINNSDDLYIILSENALGPLFADLEYYEQAITQYTNGKIKKFKNCEKVEYQFNNHINHIFQYKLCKLK